MSKDRYKSIAIMIKIASLEFDKVSNRILSEYDLSNSQFKILKFLLARPDEKIKQIDIERYFSMTNPTVTGLLQNLEKKGMIERIENPENKRSKLVRPTQRVYDMENELNKLGARLEKEFTKNLNASERKQMKELLRKILTEQE